METKFTHKEKEMLIILLQKEENTLLIELNHASHREFKALLKEKLQTVISLMGKLKIDEAVFNL